MAVSVLGLVGCVSMIGCCVFVNRVLGFSGLVGVGFGVKCFGFLGDVFGRRGFVVCLDLCLVFLFGVCCLFDCVLFFPDRFFVLFCGCWVVLVL